MFHFVLCTDVTTKIRLLNLRQLNPFLEIEGQAVAKLIEAQAYLKCSAMTGEGIKEVQEKTAKPSILRSLLCPSCEFNPL